MDRGIRWAIIHGVAMSQTRLSNWTKLNRTEGLPWEEPLEKEMATHSRILAWRIPWIEEPGGLQSTGLQRASLVAQIVKNCLQYRQLKCPSSSRPEFYPWGRRSPGEGNGYPLHYSCLENSMDRGVWWATVHGTTCCRTWLRDKHINN